MPYKLKNHNFFQKRLDTTRQMCYNTKVGSSSAKQKSGCGAAGSALPWGGRGRKFKSCHSDQIKPLGIRPTALFYLCDRFRTCGHSAAPSATTSGILGVVGGRSRKQSQRTVFVRGVTEIRRNEASAVPNAHFDYISGRAIAIKVLSLRP